MLVHDKLHLCLSVIMFIEDIEESSYKSSSGSSLFTSSRHATVPVVFISLTTQPGQSSCFLPNDPWGHIKITDRIW